MAFDNNPKLTPEEAAWLNTKFQTEHYDFNGKSIGFVELAPGMGRFLFRTTKSTFFSKAPENFLYRLHVLDSAEKARTNGYDAVVVITGKKLKRKSQRLRKEAVVKKSYNRYIEIPADAGLDNETIPEYVEHVRKQMNESGIAFLEFTCFLTPAQKERCGYDVIIQYMAKLDLPVEVLIQRLKKNHNNDNTRPIPSVNAFGQ